MRKQAYLSFGKPLYLVVEIIVGKIFPLSNGLKLSIKMGQRQTPFFQDINLIGWLREGLEELERVRGIVGQTGQRVEG